MRLIPGTGFMLATAVMGVLAAFPRRAECGDVPAAAFQVRSWHIDDGLPDGTITALAQTPDRYLWVGTNKGLVRFDGARFSKPEGLGKQRIEGLLVDRTGSLWIAARSGRVTQYVQGKFIPRFVPPVPSVGTPPEVGFPDEVIAPGAEPRWYAFNPLAMDAGGTVWRLRDNAEILRFRSAGAPDPVTTIGLPDGPVRGFLNDRRGDIWLFKDKGAWVFREDHWIPVALGTGFASGRMEVCAMAGHGVWSAQLSRHLTLNPQESPGPPPISEVDTGNHDVSAVLEDSHQRLWRCARWNGIDLYIPGSGWQRPPTPGPLAKCIVTTLLEDQEGGIWVGTVGEGLHQLLPRPVSMIMLPPEAADAAVTSTCPGLGGTQWMSTRGHGLYRMQQGSFHHFGTADGLPTDFIDAVLQDRQSRLWVGTRAGLSVWDATRFTQVPGLSTATLALFEDRSGNLWAGCADGLWKLGREGGWSVFRPAETNFLDIRCITEDRDGRIWVAAIGSGVWLVQGEQLVSANQLLGMSATDQRSLFSDEDGVLWIGSLFGGLYRWGDGVLRHYTTEDGLPDDSIIGIAADNSGNLWFSSANGIFGCSALSLSQYSRGTSPPLLCRRLGTKDGLANRGCSGGGQPVIGPVDGGRLGVANMMGVAIFDPRTASPDYRTPEILIESVIADGKPLKPEVSGMRAPASTRRFEFHYTAPDLFDTRNQRFRYRLDPMDQKWINAGRVRTASFSKLAPGTYQFRVMLGGTDGAWRETLSPVTLKVVPRFWQTRWFSPLVAVAALAALAGAVTAHERRKGRRRAELQEMRHAVENERARIARDIHDDLGTQLTEIVLISEAEPPRFADPADPEPRLQRIGNRARALVQSLDEIVWTVNPRNDNLQQLLDYLCAFSEELCETAGIRCWHEVSPAPPKRPLPVEFRHHVFLAVKEAFHDTLKHARATEIWLRAATDGPSLKIEIEDNGCGFANASGDSSGNGLVNMQTRIESLGGCLTIRSELDQGTVVTFELPLPAGGARKSRPGTGG